MNLREKPVIVTGGGRDIGRACAVKLAAEGANVAINSFASSAGTEETVADVEVLGGKAIAGPGDLSQLADAEARVARTVEAFVGVDVLVNNAGGPIARKTIAEGSRENWQAVMDQHLTSTFLMIRACLPHLMTGTVVNLASQARRDGGGPGAVADATSRGAVMTMTRGLARDWGRRSASTRSARG